MAEYLLRLQLSMAASYNERVGAGSRHWMPFCPAPAVPPAVGEGLDRPCDEIVGRPGLQRPALRHCGLLLQCGDLPEQPNAVAA